MEALIGAYCCMLDELCYDEPEEAVVHMRLQHGINGSGFKHSKAEMIADLDVEKAHEKLRCLEEGFLLDQ